MSKQNSFEEPQTKESVITIGREFFPASYPLHWHKHGEIIVYPGEGKSTNPVICVNQQQIVLQPGDALFIWPGEPHEVISNPGNHLLGCQFVMSVLNNVPDFEPYLNVFRTYHLIRGSEQPGLSQSVILYLSHLHEITKQDSLFPNVEQTITLYELFMEFARYIHNKIAPMQEKALEKMDQACRFIQANCSKDLSLESVASEIGFSSCYFSRVFKQTTHYSFVNYLNIQRVRLAQRLLTDASNSVTEVSYQAGFKSISTFNRVFKQFRGCSPSEYRKYYTDELK